MTLKSKINFFDTICRSKPIVFYKIAALNFLKPSRGIPPTGPDPINIFNSNMTPSSLTSTLGALVLRTFIILTSQIFLTTGGCPADSLRQAHVIFRHGDRTPINSYPNDPYSDVQKYWPQGFGQLNSKGKLREFELGGFLRTRYSRLTGTNYNRRVIFAQSSDLDRAIQSGEAVLAGIFPPFSGDGSNTWNSNLNWDPIPVHSIPGCIDNLITFAASCPEYQRLLEQLVETDPEVGRIHKENLDLFRYLKNHTGLRKFGGRSKVYDLKTAAEIHDTLFVQADHGLQLPNWTKAIFPNKTSRIAHLGFELTSWTKTLKRLFGGPLMSLIINRMVRGSGSQPNTTDQGHGQGCSSCSLDQKTKRSMIVPNRSHKLFLYSGHDTTIVKILTLLGLYDGSFIPPYGSSLMIELHQHQGQVHDKTDGGKVKSEGCKCDQGIPCMGGKDKGYIVKVFYHNDSGKAPMELAVPSCSKGSKRHSICTLDKFKDLMSPYTYNNQLEWMHECGRPIGCSFCDVLKMLWSPFVYFYNKMSEDACI